MVARVIAGIRPVLHLLRDSLTGWHARRLNPLAPAPLVLSVALRLADARRTR